MKLIWMGEGVGVSVKGLSKGDLCGDESCVLSMTVTQVYTCGQIWSHRPCRKVELSVLVL